VGWQAKLPASVTQAWDHALIARTDAAALGGGGARAEYATHFAVPEGQGEAEPGFPPRMPHYFRHTSRFRNHQHARALMRLRCCSPPFAASPTLHYGGDTSCPHCPSTPETSEHALLDCPAYAGLRADPRFSPLFAALPAQTRLRALASAADQFALGAFVHACFERRAQLAPSETR
jgi:hypothetical protein